MPSQNPTSAGEEVVKPNPQTRPIAERIANTIHNLIVKRHGWNHLAVVGILHHELDELLPASPPPSGTTLSCEHQHLKWADGAPLRQQCRDCGVEVALSSAPQVFSRVSSGVAHAEQTNAVKSRDATVSGQGARIDEPDTMAESTASIQSGPLESNAVASPSARPAEPTIGELQADTVMGVWCAGELMKVPQPMKDYWPFWQRVADYVNKYYTPRPAAPSSTEGEAKMSCAHRQTTLVIDQSSGEPIVESLVCNDCLRRFQEVPAASAPNAGQPVIKRLTS